MEQRKSGFPWVFQLFKRKESRENRSTSDGFASNTSSENEVNTTLVAEKPGMEDFKIVRQIGKGGFGRVFISIRRSVTLICNHRNDSGILMPPFL